MIGPLEGDGEETFDFLACSPAWLQGNVKTGYRWGRGLLILTEYDYATVLGAVETLCRSTEGSDWKEIALKLTKFLSWEFDDYTP